MKYIYLYNRLTSVKDSKKSPRDLTEDEIKKMGVIIA